MKKKLSYFRKMVKTSLKYYIIAILLMAAVIVNIILLGSNMIASDEIKSQVSDTNANLIKLYMKQMDERFYNVERSLTNLLLNDDNIITVESDRSDDRRQLAIQALSNTLTELNTLYSDMDGLFMYNAERNIMLCNNVTGSQASEKSALREYIRNGLLDDEATVYDNWAIYNIYEKYYFVRLVRSGVTTVGAFVCVDNFIDKFNSMAVDEFRYFYFTDGAGKPLTLDSTLQQYVVNTSDKLKEYSLKTNGNKYIVVGQPSEKGDFYLIGLLLKKDITSGLRKIQIINGVFCICIVGGIIWLLKIFNQKITRPVNKIIDAMNGIEEDGLEIRLEIGESFDEFQKIEKHFNEMIGEIKQLKIEVYEETLQRKDAKLRYLQLQVNPHFFLNSLNVIYSLVATKNFELVKKMVLALVKHSRYSLRANTKNVLISEELEFIQNFIEIQRTRFYYDLNFTMEVEEGVKDYRLPPLIIHTFIENSVKYAVIDGKVVSINLRISKRIKNSKPYIYIMIEDAGPGFPEEVLRSIEGAERFIDKDGEEHYGITNAMQRFWIQYHEENSLVLSNISTGGARVEIWIPEEQG